MGKGGPRKRKNKVRQSIDGQRKTKRTHFLGHVGKEKKGGTNTNQKNTHRRQVGLKGPTNGRGGIYPSTFRKEGGNGGKCQELWKTPQRLRGELIVRK